MDGTGAMNFAAQSKGGKNSGLRANKARQRAEAEEQRVKAEWKEYTTDNGKKAYYHIVTGQTAWKFPIPFHIY